MRRDLALDASPSLSAPLRFILNAPVFASIAAALLFYAGPSAFATRWSPFTLAVTHLMTLGVFASVMMGALIQILPVVTGAHVAWTRISATSVHALLTLGTAVLAAAFIHSESELFPLAASLCGCAVSWFVLASTIGLVRRPSIDARGIVDILRAVRLALAALLVTVGLGAVLAVALSWPLPLSIVALTDLHLTWGVAGWIGLLTAGVAYQVIPMFQVTEPYPRRLTRVFAPISFLGLIAVSLPSGLLQRRWANASLAIDGLLFGGYAAFAIVTLVLLHHRKRPTADATTLFWRTSMISVVCCLPTWAMATATGRPSFTVAIGVLLLVGAVGSAINGMLYKIVPFLLWYHMQASIDVRSPLIPKMKTVLPDAHGCAQYWAHFCALLMLLAASAWPETLTRPAAAAFGISNVWFGVNLVRALRVYRRVRRQISISSAVR